jgi:hypothetical protein
MKNNHNTILFNVACRTVLGLTPIVERRVLNYINDVMNGDGLYKDASQEIILEAYADINYLTWQSHTWVDLISEILDQIDTN